MTASSPAKRSRSDFAFLPPILFCIHCHLFKKNLFIHRIFFVSRKKKHRRRGAAGFKKSCCVKSFPFPEWRRRCLARRWPRNAGALPLLLLPFGAHSSSLLSLSHSFLRHRLLHVPLTQSRPLLLPFPHTVKVAMWVGLEVFFLSSISLHKERKKNTRRRRRGENEGEKRRRQREARV